MKKPTSRIFAVVLITLMSCGGGQKDQPAGTTAEPNQLELEYIKKRDGYLEAMKQLEATSKDWDVIDRTNAAALDDLQAQLREILAGTHFGQTGTINLETLLDEIGFGMLDGLSLQHDSSTRLFYTSKALFNAYFKWTSPSISPDSLAMIFNSAFVADAQVTNLGFAEFDVEGNKAYGIAAMLSQEILPATPAIIYVLVPIGNEIYMAEQGLDKQLWEYPDCNLIWENGMAEIQKEFPSRDTTGIERRWKMEEKTFNDYSACYKSTLEKDAQFESIKEKMKVLAGYLVKP